MPVGSIAITEVVHIRTSATKGNQQLIQLEMATSVCELRCATQIEGQKWTSVLTDLVLKNTANGTCSQGQQAITGSQSTLPAAIVMELKSNKLYAMRTKSYDVEMKSNSLINYVGPCILEVSKTHLVVIRKEGTLPVVLAKWDIKMLRCHWYTESIFEMEVGRRSSTGEGIVNFGTTQGAEISNQIKMIVNVWIQQASITATVMNEDLSTLKLSTPIGMDGKSNSSGTDAKSSTADFVLRNPLSSTAKSQGTQGGIHRRSRSLNDLLCGSHTLSDDMTSPVRALKWCSKPFSPYLALHHFPTTTQLKNMDRYHHLQIELTPETGELFDQVEVKSPKLPYNHLKFMLPDQRECVQKETVIPLQSQARVKQNCPLEEPPYQNFPIQFTKESSTHTEKQIETNSDFPLYVNIGVSSQAHNKPQDLAEKSLENEMAHRRSGNEMEEMSNIYATIEMKQLHTNTSDARMDKQPPLVHDRRMAYKEKQTANSRSSGEYSYPVIRGFRFRGKDPTPAGKQIETDDECHYYGSTVQLMNHDDDESVDYYECSPKEGIPDVPHSHNFSTMVESEVGGTVAQKTTSSSVPSSPEISRLHPSEQSKKDLKLALTSLPPIKNLRDEILRRDCLRPRAYQMDSKK